MNLKEHAISHVEFLEKTKSPLIWELSLLTAPYTNENMVLPAPAHQHMSVEKMTTLEAIFNNPKSTVTILNFANYFYPGGGFMSGAMAQEESLCHNSLLYPILKNQPEWYEYNRQHPNKGLYEHRALYTPNVPFWDIGEEKCANVITAAAPNVYTMQATPEENTKALKERINMIAGIVADNPVDVLILGAWGCGAFGQNPAMVATLMQNTNWLGAKEVVFAIPDEKNYSVFKDIIGG